MPARAMPSRRAVLRAAAALPVALAASPAFAARRAEKPLPIIFVHGNGDSAASWMTTIWRFESNGYPSELLTAIDFRDPLATRFWDRSQPGHSTVADETQQLADTVAAVRKQTHAAKVILIAQSRGGDIVRNYLKNAGGAAHTAIAVLCGAVDHGVVVSDTILVDSEFNGASPFLRDLNSTPGEVVPGVRFLTIRSDDDDKYAQPDGRFIGHPGLATGVGYDAPALKGATNLVIPRIDHRETGFGPAAFAAMYRFITGHEPRFRDVRREPSVVLDGTVSAYFDGAPTNIGIPGATIEVYQVARDTGERMGNALLRKVTGEDGVWGPLKTLPKTYLEFVVAVTGFPVTHIYRSPFLRSSRYVDLRPMLLTKDDQAAGAVVYMSRPRGYFGVGRDHVLLDGRTPPGIPPGVPSVSMAKLDFPASPSETVLAVFDHERIAARTWPIANGEVSVAEFTW
jgi:pimeloyl-ACP methyl ester carboxylesterase